MAVKINMFGDPIPTDACCAPLDDDYECKYGWSVGCCPHLGFYKEGKWEGHSYCEMRHY